MPSMILKIKRALANPRLAKSRLLNLLVNVFKVPPKLVNYHALPVRIQNGKDAVPGDVIYYRKGKLLTCQLPGNESSWEGLSEDSVRWGSSFKSSKLRVEKDFSVRSYSDVIVYTHIDDCSNHFFAIVDRKHRVIQANGTGFRREMAVDIRNAAVHSRIQSADWICEIWMSNYWHWTLQHLFKVWFYQKLGTNNPILIPAHYKKNKFMRESLKLLSATNVVFFEGTVAIQSLNVMASDFFPDAEFPMFRHDLVARCGLSDVKATERLFIRRKPAEKRVLENEAELLQVLEDRGFKAVYMEEYSFSEQMKMAVQSKIIVGLHGAGMANCLFMQKGGYVLELMFHDYMQPGTFQFSNILGIHYEYLVGENVDTGQQDLRSLSVDVSALKQAVDQLILKASTESP